MSLRRTAPFLAVLAAHVTAQEAVAAPQTAVIRVATGEPGSPVNPMIFGNIMLAEGKHFALRPTYHALKLYRDHFSGRRLPCEVEAGTYASPRLGVAPAQRDVPSLDAVAALRDDGSLVVGCVWRRTGDSCQVSVELAGRQPAAATVHGLVADGPLATNTRVETRAARAVDGKVTFELPPVSAAVVVVQ